MQSMAKRPILGGNQEPHGYNQEACDAECAALERALEEVAKRRTAPERVTIFTVAQAGSGEWYRRI